MDLFLKPKGRTCFIEHHEYYYKEDRVEENQFVKIPEAILFNKKSDKVCFQILENECFQTSFFVGVDWLIENEKAVYIQPKLNKDSPEQTDYLRMLFDALKHPEVSNYVDELFDIKWDSKPIEIEQEQDLLTPLLVVHFLRLVKRIVQKGLKKSYYKVEQNLHAKVKGKILVSKTIKHNILKNKNLLTICSFDEFGINGLENRLLKKALTFIQRYISSPQLAHAKDFIEQSYNYINPAFEFVSSVVNINEIKLAKTNPFYKEYGEAIKLAKIILKRFGYNISNVKPNNKISTPPFWIDMSKLFELYVLGLLLDKYGSEHIDYQFHGKGTYLDFLLTKPGESMIIDAKYKPTINEYVATDDIRQLSGYARDVKVYKALMKKDLSIQMNQVLPCLFIYPIRHADVNESNENQRNGLDDFKVEENIHFVDFYSQKIKLPIIKSFSQHSILKTK